jgi:hypothetical protein
MGQSPYNERGLFISKVYYVSKLQPIKIRIAASIVAINAVNLTFLSQYAGLITLQTVKDSRLQFTFLYEVFFPTNALFIKT